MVEGGLITRKFFSFGVRVTNLTADHMEETRHVGSCSPVGEDVRIPIVAPLWPALLIYHRFFGVRRSQRHNLTPIAPESSIREAVSAPTATLLLGPASCLDAGPAFLCAIAFLGKTRHCAPHLYPSVNCERLDSLVITRAGRGGPGIIKESRSVVGRLSAIRAPLQSLPAQTATAQQATAAARATGATKPLVTRRKKGRLSRPRKRV